MIDRLVAALNQELELSATEIADTLWLALQIGELPRELRVEEVEQPQSSLKRGELEIPPGVENRASGLEEVPPKQLQDEPRAEVYPRNQWDTGFTGLSLRVPDAPALREPLTLARALKPLMRRIAAGTTLVLDEAATVERIAEEELWIPVLKPALESWLDLELVVDVGISMQIWRQTIGELERLLKNYGIFRDVRVWSLIIDDRSQVQIRRGIGAAAKDQPLRSPKELIDPTGRRLVLVVSDCVSSLWREGRVTPALDLWASHGTMAIVQMLPQWLWKRTALGRATEVRLQGLIPGEFNQNLSTQEVSLWDELNPNSGVKVPVFTLEADRMGSWANMLAGRGKGGTSGYVFKKEPFVRGVRGDGSEDTSVSLHPNYDRPENRVQAFRVTASPMARKLAGLLAAAPVISLPVVRLIQDTLLKESRQVHVAEVFLGGLLKPLGEIEEETNPNDVQYEFIDGVRDLLVESVPLEYVLNVVDAVSGYVAKKLGCSLAEFAAVLRNPLEAGDREIVGDVGYFATITAQVLRSLGGEYVKVAEELESYNKDHQNNIETNFKENYNFLWEQGNTKIYSFCTNKPWTLPFDALVIPVGIEVHFGGLGDSFADSLGENSIYLYDSINKAKRDMSISVISPNKPLLITLPPEINNTDKHERFIICATVESPIINLSNVGEAAEAIINASTNRGLKYIVFPLLGAGRNRLPINEVALQILSAVQKIINSSLSSSIESIIVIDNEESTITIVNQIAHSLFHQKEIDGVQLISAQGINYIQLRTLLMTQDWEKADQETAKLILQASGQEERGWLDEEDMKILPSIDLQIIDQLWLKYSNERFGFSIQKKIWLRVGGQLGKYDNEVYKRFAEVVGWYIKSSDYWLAWSENYFHLDAPQGHLPRHLPSLHKRIRHYLFYRQDLKVKLENSVSQEYSIIESSINNQNLEGSLSVTPNEKLLNNQENISRNKYSDIILIGDRGAGKTTFLAALNYLSSIDSDRPYQISPYNEQSDRLLQCAGDILEQGLSFPHQSGVEGLPLYRFKISLKPTLFIQPVIAFGKPNLEMNISAMEYSGDLFNNLINRNVHGDYLDYCVNGSQLLFLIDGNSHLSDDKYSKAVIRLSEEIAIRLENNKRALSKYRIAVVISKIEQPSLWIYRHQAQKIMSSGFARTQHAFKRWSQSWGCQISYFACSSFGIVGNIYPEPNCKIVNRGNIGTTVVISRPSFWKPFGLLAPIYWLHTGKNDPRLQE